MFGIFERYFENNKKKKKMNNIVKIVDIGHYEENNYESGGAKKIIRVLGECTEREGMWTLAEKDAKGVNKLISEYDLLNNFTPLVTAKSEKGNNGDRKVLNKNLIFGGIEELPDNLELIPETVIFDDVIQNETETINPNITQRIEQYESRKSVNYSEPKIVEDPNLTFHKTVIQKFKLPNGETQKNNLLVELDTVFDLVKLIDAIDLMSLNPETVLDVMLLDVNFKKSLVQLFNGGIIKKTSELTVEESQPKFIPVVQPYVEESQPKEASSIQVTGKPNYENVAKIVVSETFNNTEFKNNNLWKKETDNDNSPVTEQPKVTDDSIEILLSRIAKLNKKE